MDLANEEKLLFLEVKTLADEAMERSRSLLDDEGSPRYLMGMAQVVVCRDLLKYLIDNDDLSDFGEMLEAAAENEYSRYQDAWGAGDRKEMTIRLSHVRILRRLMRRLTNPLRRQSLVSRLGSPL